MVYKKDNKFGVRYKKGHIPWSKNNPKFCGENNPSKRIDIRRKISIANKGNQNWKFRKKHIGGYGGGYPKGSRQPEHSKRMKEIWKNKEYRKKVLGRRKKSLLEIKFEKIIKELNLPYKFVGNGKFFVENKCPDFINCNGEKIAIEIFYRRHKEQFRGGLEKWKQNRQKTFNKYGWKILFFNETQINEKEVLQCL